MYDGIKIECTLNDRLRFSDALEMVGRYNEDTGEVMPLTADARYNALTFARIPGPAAPRFMVQGSLHRFYNNGGLNDNDYTLTQVKETLQTLKDKYSIDPDKSKIINFEFGVNIQLPPGMDAQAFNKYLVSAQFKSFEKLNPRRPAVGYIAEFNEFSIKIYDKGYQAKTGATDLVRVEIKVNRTRWLDQFGFKKGKDLFLSDLINPANVKILGDILLNKISSLILTPREIDLRLLTKKQVITFFQCRDARSWEEWDSKQRLRKKAQLKAIFERINQPDPLDILTNLVAKKWADITHEETITPTVTVPKTPVKRRYIHLIVEGITDILGLFKMSVGVRVGVRTVNFYMYYPRGVTLTTGPPRQKVKSWVVPRLIEQRIRGPPRQ